MEKLINIILILLLFNSFLLFNKKSLILGCGLVGFCGVEDFDYKKIQILMLANMSRGMHSTGFYNNGKITKDPGPAIELLAKHKLVPEKLFIGHDRYATVGVKNRENAHPFEENGIILVHNGTLINHWQLSRDYGLDYYKYSVDSHVITEIISRQKDNYKILSEIDGAAALIWTDRTNPDVLRVFRNDKRPLFYGKSKEGIYISSLEDSLELIGCNKIKSFKTNYVYYIKNGIIDVNKGKRITTQKGSTWKAPNTNTHSSVSTTSFSYKSHWVRALKTNTYTGIVADKWYLVDRDYGNGYYSIRKDSITTQMIFNKEFEERKVLVIGDFLVATETASNNLIKSDKIYMIEEIKKEDDYIKLTVTDLDTNVGYTWGADYFRPAMDDEIEEYLNKASSQLLLPFKEEDDFSDIEDDFVSYFESDLLDEAFENSLFNLYGVFDITNDKLSSIIDEMINLKDSLKEKDLFKINKVINEITNLDKSILGVIDEFDLYLTDYNVQ